MSPSPVREDKYRQPLAQRCLAVVLRTAIAAEDVSDTSCNGNAGGSRAKRSSVSPENRASFRLEEGATPAGPGPPTRETAIDDGYMVFQCFLRENVECFWNPCLVQSVSSLEYKGLLLPSTLLVTSTDYSLEIVRSAWARRVLRPPPGYEILKLGDVDAVEMTIVPQTQFAPLSEALCKVVYELNTDGVIATMNVIANHLKASFPEMVVPEDEILYRTLGSLIRERKLYHTGHGYSVVTPETYRLTAASPPYERQMLMTNEEAIIRLHSTRLTMTTEDAERFNKSRSTQAEQKDILTAWSSSDKILVPTKYAGEVDTKPPKLKRSHSLRLLRGKDKERLNRSNSLRMSGCSPLAVKEGDSKSDSENHDPIKKEKVSVFMKLFRLGRGEKNSAKTPKYATFSAQFPPPEWLDPSCVHFHSRATQTLKRDANSKSKVRSSSASRASSGDRYSLHLQSTPVGTPHGDRRNRLAQEVSDVSQYHSRSTSLPRRNFPQMQPEGSTSSVSRRVATSSSRRSSPRTPSSGHHHHHHHHYRHHHQQQQYHDPQRDSPPSHLPTRCRDGTSAHRTSTRDTLRPEDSHKRLSAEFQSVPRSTVVPYRPQPFPSLNSSPERVSSGRHPPPPPPPPLLQSCGSIRRSAVAGIPQATWRTLTAAPPSSSSSTDPKLGVSEPVKKTSSVMPHRNPVREVASVPPSVPPAPQPVKPKSNNPPEVEKKTEIIVKTTTPNSKDMIMDSSVDFEISIGPSKIGEQNSTVGCNSSVNKQKVGTAPVSSSARELLKTTVAATWNHSISGKATIKKADGRPAVTTHTSITTSMSHSSLKDLKKAVAVPSKVVHSTNSSPVHAKKGSPILDCRGMHSDVFSDIDDHTTRPPTRTKLAEAKAAFFADPPGSGQQSSKEDSGFSSSGSTTHPTSIAISP